MTGSRATLHIPGFAKRLWNESLLEEVRWPDRCPNTPGAGSRVSDAFSCDLTARGGAGALRFRLTVNATTTSHRSAPEPA